MYAYTYTICLSLGFFGNPNFWSPANDVLLFRALTPNSFGKIRTEPKVIYFAAITYHHTTSADFMNTKYIIIIYTRIVKTRI